MSPCMCVCVCVCVLYMITWKLPVGTTIRLLVAPAWYTLSKWESLADMTVCLVEFRNGQSKTCDTNSLLIVILMWSEGGLYASFPMLKTSRRMQQNRNVLWSRCQDIHIVWSWQFPSASGHTKGPLAASQHLRSLWLVLCTCLLYIALHISVYKL